MYFVVIRTNGNLCELTIDAENSTVKHFGHANFTKVVAVASHSYHENGTSHSLEVTASNVAIEETGA